MMSSVEHPRVSVVVPHFRRGAALAPTLESALGQQGVDVEVLIVDDASGEPARTELEALRSARVRIVDQPVNAGVSAARRRGTELAGAPWVAYLDDDDLWDHDHLRACLAAAGAAGARWAYGAVRYVDERGRLLYEPPVVPGHRVRATLVSAQALITPSALVVERDLARATGWDSRLSALADWDFALRLAEVAPGAASPRRTVGYVRHARALSRGSVSRAYDELAYLQHKRRAVGAPPVDTASFHQWVAYELRAGGERVPAARAFLRAAVTGRKPAHAARAVRVLLRG